MIKNTANSGTRHGTSTADKSDIQVYVEKNYFRHVDQLDRWRQEYEQKQAVEKRLTDLSRLSYDPVDYEPQLEPIPFEERPVPSFDYLLDEAVIAAESKFFVPIGVHIVLMLILVVILFVSSNAIALRLSGTLGIGVVVSLFLTFRRRRNVIETTEQNVKEEIERRRQHEIEVIQAKKTEHDKKENERVESVRNLLDGDTGSIMLRLDTVLQAMDLPFPATVDIDLYGGVPLITVWLPPKTIIPPQNCELLDTGRVSYTEKEQRTINKQYVELSCSLLVKIASVIYENIPSFDKGYLRGMTSSGLNNECLVTVAFDRDILVSATSAFNGLAAVGMMQGKYKCDKVLNLLPVDTKNPEEWGDVAPQMVHSLHIKIMK